MADTENDKAADAFISEVNENYEREKLKSAWDRYGRTLITAVSLGLIAFAGYLFWQNNQQKQRIADADKYVAATKEITAGNVADGQKALADLQKNGTRGYKVLAAFDEAGLAIKNENAESAAKKYDALAARSDVPAPLRDLAKIRAIVLRFDTLAPKEAIAQLAPFAQPDKPWFATAAELTAIAHLKDGNTETARKLFEQLAQPVKSLSGGSEAVVDDVPSSVRQRAAQMAQMLGSTVKAPQPTIAEQ